MPEDKKISEFLELEETTEDSIIPIVEADENFYIKATNLVKSATDTTLGVIRLTGDLEGTALSPKVGGIDGIPIDSTDIADDKGLFYDVASNSLKYKYAPSALDYLRYENITVYIKGSVVNNEEIYIERNSYFPYTVVRVVTKSKQGSCGFRIYSGTTLVSDISEISVTTTDTTTSFTFDVQDTDDWSIRFSNVSSVQDIYISFTIERVSP